MINEHDLDEYHEMIDSITKNTPRKWRCDGEPQVEIPEYLVSLVRETHEKLKELSPDYEVHQIKQKFFDLRYYFDAGEVSKDVADTMRAVVREAERLGTEQLHRHNNIAPIKR